MNENKLDYPRVKEYLRHIASGTYITIEDDIFEDKKYYEGTVSGYLQSEVVIKDLNLINLSVKDNAIIVRAVENF